VLLTAEIHVSFAQDPLNETVANKDFLFQDGPLTQVSENNHVTILPVFLSLLDYNSRSLVNDIAVIRTSTTFRWTNQVQPICLPTSSPTINENLEVSGWGATTTSGSNYLTTLKTVHTCSFY